MRLYFRLSLLQSIRIWQRFVIKFLLSTVSGFASAQFSEVDVPVEKTTWTPEIGNDETAILLDADDLFPPESLNRKAIASGVRPTLWKRIVSDHKNYYDLQSFQLLAGGFLVGAAIANTQVDDELHRHFQSSVRGATSDDWSETLHANKELGNGVYALPLFATAWAAGEFFDESPVLVTTSHWGERSLRSFLVGAPPLILAQRLTGGSRPGETSDGSN